MTVASQWWSQRFSAEGSQTAAGILNQLGRSGLAPFQILVREAVQNSWDARRGDAISVRFDLRRLGDRADAWNKLLLPEPIGLAVPGQKSEFSADSWVLVISDRGTMGLGGPIRADEPNPSRAVANFVQFMRNVGEPRDRDMGGGTYGFGKGILYSCSRRSTIVVDTCTGEDGNKGRRLMGAALGSKFEDNEGRPYTGRHWWGVINNGKPDPLLGSDAIEVARALGLPGFTDGSTGTDVVIVEPELDLVGIEGDPQALGQALMTSVVWHLWPKLGSSMRPASISFEILVDGTPIEIPALEETPILCDFSRALDAIHVGNGTPLTRKSAPKVVGELALETTPNDPRIGLRMTGPTEAVWAARPFEPPFRHVARMRVPELIVDYLPTTVGAHPAAGYVGVFRASPEADEHFAISEPPTHDTWQTAGLTKVNLGVVREQSRFLRSETEDFTRTISGGQSKVIEGLGRLSSALGSLVDGQGTAPTPRRARPTVSPRKATKKARVVDNARVEIVDGKPVVRVTVEVPDTGHSIIAVEAAARVILGNGSAESAGPTGARVPRIRRWYREGKQVDGHVLDAGRDDHGLWTVEADHIPDAAVRITVTTMEDGDA